MTIEEKLSLLLKDSLSIKDVMALSGRGRTKAYQIMKTARDVYNGKAGCFVNYITPVSYCKAISSSLEEQLSALEVARVARFNHEAD